MASTKTRSRKRASEKPSKNKPPKVWVADDAFADDELGKDTYMVDLKTGKKLKLDDTVGYERIIEFFGK